jgi:[ribosomal protein S18]-alanine N-acetyltransferase
MLAQNIAIRLAREDDAEIIARMSRDLIETGLGWSWTGQRVRKAIAHRDTLSLVACKETPAGERRNAAPLAFAIAYFGDEQAHLNLLAVLPEHQRTGIGKRLVAWATESALVAGIRTVNLELRLRNAAGRSFYRALGFKDTALVPNYYRGVETAVRMSRDITLRSSSSERGIWRPS